MAASFNKETAKSIDRGLSNFVPEGFSIDLNSAVLIMNRRLPVLGSLQYTTEKVFGASFGASIDFSKLPFLDKIVPSQDMNWASTIFSWCWLQRLSPEKKPLL